MVSVVALESLHVHFNPLLTYLYLRGQIKGTTHNVYCLIESGIKIEPDEKGDMHIYEAKGKGKPYQSKTIINIMRKIGAEPRETGKSGE